MKRITVKLRKQDVDWLDMMIAKQRFASYSHAFRFLIEYYKMLHLMQFEPSSVKIKKVGGEIEI